MAEVDAAGSPAATTNGALVRLVGTHLLAVIAEYAAIVGVLVYAFERGGAGTTGLASLAVLTPTLVGGADRRGAHAQRGARSVVRRWGLAAQAAGYGAAAVAAAADASVWLVVAAVVVSLGRGQHPPTDRCGAAARGRAHQPGADRRQPLDSRTASAPARWSARSCRPGSWPSAAPSAVLAGCAAVAAAGPARLGAAGRPGPAGRGRRPQLAARAAGRRCRRHRPGAPVGRRPPRRVPRPLRHPRRPRRAPRRPGLRRARPESVRCGLAQRPRRRRRGGQRRGGDGGRPPDPAGPVAGRRAGHVGAASASRSAPSTSLAVAVVALPLLGLVPRWSTASGRMLLQRSADPRRSAGVFALVEFVGGIGLLLGSGLAQLLVAVADVEVAFFGVGGAARWRSWS